MDDDIVVLKTIYSSTFGNRDSYDIDEDDLDVEDEKKEE